MMVRSYISINMHEAKVLFKQKNKTIKRIAKHLAKLHHPGEYAG